ncbi:MAG: hypothetical protein R8F63_11605 [Acidimicrobiales bacterium]|nr:hypothetical protein [Acidimicrobiales bacterium]
MPLRRVALLLAVVATACAPGPDLNADADDPDEPTATTTTLPSESTTTTVAPDEPTLPTLPEIEPGPVDDAPAGPVDPIDGRAVLQNRVVTIRAGEEVIEVPTTGLPTQPTWSRDGERLVFLTNRNGASSVVVTDPDGTVIADQAATRPYFFFSWSHDGTRIAALGPGDERTTLDVLDADGAVLQTDVADAQSLWIAWDPQSLRLAAHADERLLRVDADGTATDLGEVGLQFFAPKWIPGRDEILLVVDIEGTETLVRRGLDGGDTLVALGSVETETSIVVNPDGRTAALTILFDVEGGGGGVGERTALGPPLAQETPARSGRVDIIDLDTGERVPVFTGHALWVEWNPMGDRLLVGTADIAEGTGAWWVYEHDDPFADAAAEIEPTVTLAVASYVPTRVFLASYLVFADQFVEQPRLWAPTGDRFIYTTDTTDGGWAMAAALDDLGRPDKIGPAAVAFWSPVG